jgi:ubiquinone/menaquinone biosynthesis C-methylase UbiE
LRWEATAEERRLAETASTPLSPRAVARVLLRSPGVLPEAIRLGVKAAVAGVWTDSGLRNLLNAERVQQVLPHLVPGAAYFSPEQPFLDALLRCLDAEFTVLDLGCGPGRIARLVAPHVRRVVCADVSRFMIDTARTQLVEHSNVDFRLVDGRTLSAFPAATFDVIYSHAVFYLFDLVPALGLIDEMRRVLRPGGMAVISFRTIDQPLWAAQALTDSRVVLRRGHGAGHFRPYTSAQLTEMFALVGLPVVDRCSSDRDDPWGYVVLTAKAPEEPVKAADGSSQIDVMSATR